MINLVWPVTQFYSAERCVEVMQWSLCSQSHVRCFEHSCYRTGDLVQMECKFSPTLTCSCFRRATPPHGNVFRLFDALFTFAHQRTCPLPRPLCTSLSLRNPPPSRWRLWSIWARLPVPHVIFFLWHGSPLHAAWYSGAGMHAPSQIHQLRSECRTTAWKIEGWEEGGGEREDGGKREREAGQGLADILPGLKRQTDREMEWERGIWEDKGKSEKEPFLISAGCHFC